MGPDDSEKGIRSEAASRLKSPDYKPEDDTEEDEESEELPKAPRINFGKEDMEGIQNWISWLGG